MSNRRKLRPHELARQDQVLASTRDYALRNPDTVVTTTSYATGGEYCEWCDCTEDTDDHNPACEACPVPAVYVLSVTQATAGSRMLPVCAGHYGDAAEWLLQMFGDVPSLDLELVPIRDSDT